MTGAGEGTEERLDVPRLEAHLDELERLLDAHLAAGGGQVSPDLIALLEKLWKVWSPRLLRRLCARRGTRLEEKLTEWLIRLAPSDDDAPDRRERANALGVLRRIGGGGFGRVSRHYLDGTSGAPSGTWVKYAKQATPDSETIESLFHAAMSDVLFELDDDWHVPLHQMEAMEALAGAKAWEKLIRAVIRWGASCEPHIVSCRVGQGPLGDDLCRPALDALAVAGDPGAGPILALGLAGRKDQLEWIRGVCRAVPAEADTALGCAVALGLLRDDSEEAASFLASQLTVERHAMQATAALLRIGGEAAHRVLLLRLEEQFDRKLAAQLLAQHESPEEVSPLIVRELKTTDIEESCYILKAMFATVKDEERIELVLSDPELKIRITEEALAAEVPVGKCGDRTTFVRAMSRWSSDGGYAAALQVLEWGRSLDRQRSAFLLCDIDPVHAARDLFSLLLSESWETVRWAMGQALAEIVSDEELRGWLGSDAAPERRAACIVSGYRPPSEWLSLRLAELLEDQDREVAGAATEALDRQEVATDVEELIASYASERDAAGRWLMVDAMIVIGDPGFIDCPPPRWVSRVTSMLEYPSRDYFEDHIGNKRKGYNYGLKKNYWR